MGGWQKIVGKSHFGFRPVPGQNSRPAPPTTISHASSPSLILVMTHRVRAIIPILQKKETEN